MRRIPAVGSRSLACTTPLRKSTNLSITKSSPTVANGVVYIGGSFGGLCAFAGADGCAPPFMGRRRG
jgi:hypothetical protein